MTDAAGVAVTTVYFILIVVNVVGNSFVCAIIKNNRDMRYAQTIALSDILNALLSRFKLFPSLFSASNVMT